MAAPKIPLQNENAHAFHEPPLFHGCKPTALASSPDGGRLAYAGNGNRCGRGDEITVKVWEVNGRKPATRLSVKSERVDAIANRVVVASESQIQCFSIPSGDPVWSVAKRAQHLRTQVFPTTKAHKELQRAAVLTVDQRSLRWAACLVRTHPPRIE